MCNVYSFRKSAAEFTAYFGIEVLISSRAGDERYPGTPGLVVREADGRRAMRSMAWSVPLGRRTMSPTAEPWKVRCTAVALAGA